MKRFTFFIGVFCAGLVLFLLFTGQFSKVFTGGGATDDSLPEWAQKTRDETTNRVTYPEYDHEKGRLRFHLVGDLMDAAIRIDQVNAPKAMANAEITIPIYRTDSDLVEAESGGFTSMTQFVMTAGEIAYQPESKLKKVILKKGIRGTGDDGSLFRTDSMEIVYREDDTAQLTGDQAIEAAFPAFEIFGSNGFEGIVDSAEGLTRLTILPPVVVALDRDQGGGLLGFRDLTADGASTDEERIFLIGDGPLVIDRAENRAEFQKQVIVFRASEASALNPAPDPTNARSRFECESLRVRFDASTLRFTDAQALSGEQPVRAYLQDANGDVYVLTADQLDWLEGTAEAKLRGGTRINGRLGEFGADHASLFPHERRCVLQDNVYARFRGAEMKQGSTEVQSDWLLAADQAEFIYGPSSKNTGSGPGGLRSFRAWSREPHQLTVTEESDAGARLVGTELSYDTEAGTAQILGDASSPAYRPQFSRGQNLMSSDRIVLHVEKQELTFDGSVQCKIDDWQLRPGQELPKWAKDRPDGEQAIARCEWLRVQWDAQRSLQALEAKARVERNGVWHGEEVLTLRLRSPEPYVIIGEHISWSQAENLLVLTGPTGKQRLESSFGWMTAERIEFDIEKMLLSATDADNVHFEAHRAKLLGKAEDREQKIVVDCPRIEVQLQENPGKQDASKNKEDADPTAEVVAVTAWGETDRPVLITDGILVASGQLVEWAAATGILDLQGEGNQRLYRLGEFGFDELNARTIRLDTVKLQATLEGEVRATLNQGNHAPKSSGRSTGQAFTWDLRAGQVEAWFVSQKDPANPEREQLLLDRFEARQGVKLANAQASVWFNGSSCDWNRSDQTLRIYDQEGQDIQTLHHGKDKQNSVLARQIHITPNTITGNIEYLWVFVQDRVIGTFVPESNAQKIESIELYAQNLIVQLFPESEPSIRNASAWGDIRFQAGELEVLAERAIFNENQQEISFEGKPNEKVKLIHGNTMRPSDSLHLRQKPQGGYRVEMRGQQRWEGAEIREVLERIEREERIPKR